MSSLTTTAPGLPAVGVPILPCRRWATMISFLTADLMAFLLASGAAVLVRGAFSGRFTLADCLPFGPVVLLFFFVFSAMGLYPGIGVNPVSEFRRIVVGTAISYAMMIAATFLEKETSFYSRVILLFAAPLSVALVVTFRFAVRRWCSRHAWWGIPTVIIGGGESGRGVLTMLLAQPHLGFRPVAMLDRRHQVNLPHDLSSQIVQGDLSLAPLFARRHKSCYAIVTMPGLSSQQLTDVVSDWVGDFSHVLLIPDFFEFSSMWVSAKHMGGVVGFEVTQILAHRLPQLLKRGFDLVTGISGALLLLPVFVILYALVRSTSRGPVFYGQKRIGFGRGGFTAWKFRTMVQNADEVLESYLKRDPELRAQWRRDHKLKNDPRVTRVGKFLRKTSLDELPQIWNVLRGEMSLVGPRPIVQAEIPKYGKRFELYCKVRPGITGMWQISGRNDTSYEERVKFDEYYVRNWSVWLDLYILVRTVKTVLLTEGAY